MAEEFVALGIVVFVAAIMIGIGIWQIKSKNPVGFYSGEKPPKKEELSDVVLWNKKHGMMWIFYGTTMISSYLISMIIPYEFMRFIILMLVIVGGLPVMIYYHHYLIRKYWKYRE